MATMVDGTLLSLKAPYVGIHDHSALHSLTIRVCSFELFSLVGRDENGSAPCFIMDLKIVSSILLVLRCHSIASFIFILIVWIHWTGSRSRCRKLSLSHSHVIASDSFCTVPSVRRPHSAPHTSVRPFFPSMLVEQSCATPCLIEV